MRENDMMKEAFLVALGTFLSLIMAAVLMFTMTACSGTESEPEETTYKDVTVVSPYEQDQELYKAIIDKLPEGNAYAFADMGGKHDVLLVAEKTVEINGDFEATKANIYGFDKKGTIKEYGVIESSSTSMPLIAGKDAVYYGDHSTMCKAQIDEENSRLNVETAKLNSEKTVASANYDELYSEYANGIVINFTAVE